MRVFISALLLTAALAVAGCGGSSYSGGSKPGAQKTSGSSSSASSSSSGTIQVALQNIAFSPSNIKAKVGQTIKWTNKDSVAHNVTATKGEEFKSKTLNQGDTYSYKLDKAGTITYVCTFHPGMQATVTVTK
jgi:plastocyanin